MTKYIFKISSLIMILALVITSCTDEKDFVDNKPIKNNKNLEQGMLIREYNQYEQGNYEEELIELLSNFDAILKGETHDRENYTISEALITMETYFNYAIVDKQTEFNENISYEKQIFSFTTPIINEDTINLLNLREIYLEFLGDVLLEMEDKYLQFSDLYVSEIDGLNITFTLEMSPFNSGSYISHPRAKIVRPITEDFTLPDNAYSNWNGLSQGMIDDALREYVRTEVDKVIHQIQWIAQPNKPTTGVLWRFQEDPDWLNSGVNQNSWHRTGQDLKNLVYNTMAETYDVAAVYFPDKTPIDVFNAIHSNSNSYNDVKKSLYFAELFYAYTTEGDLYHFVTNLNFNY